jgi:transcriptional regulator GlxA family with amidase domain
MSVSCGGTCTSNTPGKPVTRSFKRRFEAATGYIPLDYAQSLRMEEAKQMLEATDTAIDQVAAEVGYTEPAAFKRLFKRSTGIAPLQYRLRFQQGESLHC